MNFISNSFCPTREYHCAQNGLWLRVYMLNESCVRIRYSPGNLSEDIPGYGVSPDFKAEGCLFEERETEECFVLMTSKLKVVIKKSDLTLQFIQAGTGLVLSADQSRPEYLFNDWTGDYKVCAKKKIQDGEFFYGLGDKPCDLNLSRKRYEMWGVDHYAFKMDSDPLYKNITFFLSLRKEGTYGIFFDNTCRSFFDFGASEDGVLIFGAEGGEIDYYFYHAETPLEVIQYYTRTTGLPPLPPLWALGYHQSKWSYYPDTEVENLANDFRQRQIPCDAIHLDIHHMNDYKSLTWDSVCFPRPEEMVSKLRDNGFNCVIIVNPGIKIDKDYDVWKSGYEKNCYCRRHDGELMEGVVWPGFCHFPDFTNPAVRGWWEDTVGQKIHDVGITGLWNDMNEPVVFPDKTLPLDTRHFYDGRPCSHSKAHNIYGHCMAAASFAAMEKYGGGKRPFNLSRTGYSGMQRFAATWTGDNCSTWEHIKIANFQCQRLALSGISFVGSDVGGFLEHPSSELFCRWMQLGAFHLLFRNHSSGEYGGREPWVFGEEIEGYVRFAIEERYKLLPYFYTQFYQYSRYGSPVIRSLAIQCHDLEDTFWRGVEFFVGDHLYVVPVLNEDARGVTFYVPPGVWYSLWDHKRIGPSCSDVWTEASLERMPVFVRGGAVIPRWPVQQYVGEIKDITLFLDLWWAEDTVCRSGLYEDAGDGAEHKKGEFLYHSFEYESGENCFSLKRKLKGNSEMFSKNLVLRLHALPEGNEGIFISIDHQEEFFHANNEGETEVELPGDFRFIKVRLQ